MTLVSSSPQRRYNEEDLALAENLAYRCALAVDNARLHRDRSYIACTLQRSLLPRLPEIAEIEVGVEYLPVGEESEVGGDFYDLIEVDDCWMAVIGVVCGKGAAAAALTALTRYTIRAVVMRENKPSAVLLALNETMIRQLEGDQFCTVACASLRPADGSGFELTVVRGGQHPAPLLLRAGAPSRGWIPGKALEVFPDPGLGDRTHRLRTGETMVLYTDGVVEARGPDGSFLARSGWRTSCVPPARGSRPRPSPKG
jgi:serine phosphatase RsbU (regulator of sigma subunit)